MVCRWQAERRKHYPTAANMAQKAEAAASRDARGELEPEQALRRKRLQEVPPPTTPPCPPFSPHHPLFPAGSCCALLCVSCQVSSVWHAWPFARVSVAWLSTPQLSTGHGGLTPGGRAGAVAFWGWVLSGQPASPTVRLEAGQQQALGQQ